MDDKTANSTIVAKIKDKDVPFEDVICYVKAECATNNLTPMTLGMLFEMYAGVSAVEDRPETFFSREIRIDELVNIHPGFRSTNGNQWARDYGSYLGKKYHIIRRHEKNKVSSVKLEGPNLNSVKKYRNIKTEIVNTISKQRCTILDISTTIEVDHKNGKYTELNNISLDKQKLRDFQPLSKAANDAKRSHCSECIASGKRYDARRLGYKDGWVVGDEKSPTCYGCYWYDPKRFNELISKDFNKCL